MLGLMGDLDEYGGVVSEKGYVEAKRGQPQRGRGTNGGRDELRIIFKSPSIHSFEPGLATGAE